MRLQDFNYDLPPKLIAQEPISPRDACRLLVLDRKNKTRRHEYFLNIGKFLRSGDVLVFNNSRVIPARINFLHEGKKIEIFLVRALSADSWLVLGKPGKTLQKNREFHLSEALSFQVKEILTGGERVVRFSAQGKILESLLEKMGEAPFPPYIKKPKATLEDYQTVYAKKKGSVAAPTAGLHFTDRLLKKLQAQGVQLEFVTLHVGLGTFQSIKTAEVENHTMHEEAYEIDPFTAKRLSQVYAEGRRIIAVGTTSVRVLESAFHSHHGFSSGRRMTDIYIYPGYQWRCVNGLITNFHLPKSSLFLLACSFGGKEFITEAYEEAVKKRYRFFSFGDAMFIQ